MTTPYNGIHARILTYSSNRYLLEFTKTPMDDDSWTSTIMYQMIDVQGDQRFVSLDGDIDYEWDHIEPHVELGSMVHDVLSMRWPVPWPKMEMVAAARLAYAVHPRK